MNLDYNNITKFIAWKDIGIDDIRTIGKVWDFGWSVKGMKPDCDCLMEPYLELTEFALSKIWRNHYDVTCWNPPEFRGLSIVNHFIKGNRLDQLICNVSTSEQCPRYCHSYKQPKHGRTVVNYTDAGLTALSDYLPGGGNLTLIFKGNKISYFEDREYFKRVFSVDISNNSLQNISEKAFHNMKYDVVLDLSDNQIIELPHSFQTFDPCSIPIGKLTMPCDCGHIWLSDWIKNNNADECSNVSEIVCVIEGNSLSAASIDWSTFCDEQNSSFLNILLPVLFTVVIGLALSLCVFRYEILILTHNLRKKEELCKNISNSRT